MNKELEALESIYWYIVATGAEEDYKKYYERIKKSLKDAGKHKRAVEIIKNKGIDILEFRATKKAKTYNENTKRVYVKDYTDDEYDFLKEALK